MLLLRKGVWLKSFTYDLKFPLCKYKVPVKVIPLDEFLEILWK